MNQDIKERTRKLEKQNAALEKELNSLNEKEYKCVKTQDEIAYKQNMNDKNNKKRDKREEEEESRINEELQEEIDSIDEELK
jgi:hypothetical protein